MTNVDVIMESPPNVVVIPQTTRTVTVSVPGPPGPPGAGDTGGLIFRAMTQGEFDSSTPANNQVTYIIP